MNKCIHTNDLDTVYQIVLHWQLLVDAGRISPKSALLYYILQHTATHCNTLQHTATHCNTMQHTATHCNTNQLYCIIYIKFTTKLTFDYFGQGALHRRSPVAPDKNSQKSVPQ